MVRCLALAATLACGCYAPTPSPGAPCSTAGECPSGQECRAGVCFANDTPHDAAQLDAVVDAPPPDAAAYVPWSTPVELTSLESTGSGETDPSITADKLTVVFAASVGGGDDRIYLATRDELTDTFSISELTALDAVGASDKSPEISSDGNTIYFVSNRSGGYEVYTSTFSTTWSPPMLRTDLSSGGQDSDVAISPDGLTAVVLDNDTTNRFLLHTRMTTAEAFGTGIAHAELAITGDIASPTITNDGMEIYFHAGATRELYHATRKGNGSYSTPMPVTELNVAGTRCAAPFVLQTDDYLIFERDGDLYETTR